MLSLYGLAAMVVVAGLLLTFGILSRAGHRPDWLEDAEPARVEVGEEGVAAGGLESDPALEIADQAQAWLDARSQAEGDDRWQVGDP